MNIFGGQKAQAPSQKAANGTGDADPVEEEVTEGSKVVTMQPGDYVVHILIQSAKQLVLENEDTVNPFIQVNILNQIKSTSHKDGITSSSQVKFEEHLFFTFNSLSKDQLKQAKILFNVMNKGFFKGDVIGLFEMSLSQVYNMKEHVLMHQLIGLNNPNSEDFGQITGYITVSINVQGPEDEAIELKLGTELEIKKRKPLMPASIRKQYKQLTLRIFRGENLPLTDTHTFQASTIDAYVRLRYQNCWLETKILKECNGKLAVWNQEMLVPIEIPLKDDKIHLQLWDSNLLGDELCSSMEFTIPLMFQVEKKEDDSTTTKPTLKWINMYGSRTGYKNSAALQMNEDPQSATVWKGRILVEYFVQDSKYPLSKIIDIQNPSIIVDQLKQKKYFIIGEFGRGLCLPDKKPYKLKISIGKNFWISDAPRQQKNNYCRWDQRFKDNFNETYEKFYRFPFVFIYLLDGDKEICYYKTTIQQFIEEGDTKKNKSDVKFDPFRIHWQQFNVDESLEVLKDDSFSGIFSFRLYIHDVDNKPFDFKKIEPWKTPPPSQLNKYKLRISIYQCKFLPPAYSNGSTDPILEIWTQNDEQIRTKLAQDTSNPIYYEVKDIDVEFTADTYNFMGRSVIFLSDILQEDKDGISFNDKIQNPKWHPIQRRMDDAYDPKIQPAVLCSFNIFDNKNPNLEIKEYKCEIVVLGLRNLVSAGLLPINKAFVKFNIKSMMPSDQGTALENVQTQPLEDGPNPNIRSTIQLELNMPSNPLFAPKMTCDVFDLLFIESLPQPHIGTFTLNIGDIMQEQSEKRNQFKNDLEYALKTMINIISQIEIAKQQGGDLKIQEIVNKSVVNSTFINKIKKLKTQIRDGHKTILHVQIPSSSAIKGGVLLKNIINDQGQKASYNESQIIDSILSEELLGKKNMRKQFNDIHYLQKEKTKQEIENKRQEDQKKFGNKENAYKNVVKPVYKFDLRLKVEKEFDQPPESLFYELGHDPAPQAGKKQYRRYYTDELENIIDERTKDRLIKSPFLTQTIYRSKQVKQQGLFEQWFGGNQNPEMTFYEVGQFKCNIRCFNQQDYQKIKQEQLDIVYQILEKVQKIYQIQCPDEKFDFDKNCLDEKIEKKEKDIDEQLKKLKKILSKSLLDNLNLYPLLSKMIFEKLQLKMLNTQTKCKVRLYVIQGFNFAKKDMFSDSDPYLVLKCGKTEFNERDNYQLDKSDPVFHKSYDFFVDFPGAPVLQIIAYDYDDFFGDELIGETIIDLDDRYFSQEWWAIEEKPIEFRDLRNHSCTITQGVVKIWCEINQKDSVKAISPPIDITPAPSQELELRLVIWKTKDLEGNDYDKMSDLYVRAFLEDGKDQSTDVHWRCQNGSFNYRLILPLKTQQPSYTLTIQCWDKDVISNDVLIGEAQLDVSCMVEDIVLTNRQTILHQQYFDEYFKQFVKDKKQKEIDEINKENGDIDYIYKNKDYVDDIWFDYQDKTKFWIPIGIYKKNEKIYAGQGEILCSLQIVTKAIQQRNPQGIGRSEPNNDPLCPEPEGRLKISYNPIEMIQQYVSPQLRRQIMIGIAVSVCALLCLMMLPQIVANLITKLLVG